MNCPRYPAFFCPTFAANSFDRWPALRSPLTLRFARFFHTEVSKPIRVAPANRRRGLRVFMVIGPRYPVAGAVLLTPGLLGPGLRGQYLRSLACPAAALGVALW